MISKSLISAALMMIATPVMAQLSLDDYIEAVVEYSYAIAGAEAKVEGADAEYMVARRGMLPSVSLSSDADLNSSGNKPVWAVRADVMQPIYNGGRMKAIARQQEWNLIEAERVLEGSMLDVKYEAEIAYWALSRAEIYRGAMLDYVTLVETLRDVAQHRFEEGYTSKSDLLQVESRLSDAEYLLSEAEQRWRIALHNFNTLRGVDAAMDVFLGQSVFDNFVMPLREDVTSIMERHPDYLAAVAAKEVAQYGVVIRKAHYLPTLNMGLFGLWQPPVGDSVSGGVLLSLKLPIFHFMERREALRSAMSSYTYAEVQIADVVDNITLNESNGWANLEYSYKRVKAVAHNLDIARENLEISTYSYREGVVTILDVLQAQLSWLQIYENAIAAEYDYAVAIASYRYIVGL